MIRANTLGAVINRRSRSTPSALDAVVVRNVGSHLTASAPPATTYNASYLCVDGMCFSGTRPLHTPTVSGQAGARPELHMVDIGATFGQRTRFDRSGKLVFYDTPIRKDVRRQLTGHLDGAGTMDPLRLVLTGMGGSGKSHNLARWAMEQREAGHMVVYINDMQNWLDSGDEYIFREIEFALHRWRGWKRRVGGFVGFTSSSGLLAHLNEAPDTSCIPPALSDEARSIHDVVEKAKTGGLHALNKTWTLGPSVSLSACANIASLVDKKCIFIVDQDNKLNKILYDSSFSAIKMQHAGGIIDDVIKANEAHMTVASASANNEGWDRRGWHDVVVQKAHGLDPADADHMIRAALEPAGLYSEDVSVQIQEETGCCPLDIKLLLDLLARRFSLADSIRLWKGGLVSQFLEEYCPTLSGGKLKYVVEGVLKGNNTTFMDKRFMEFSTYPKPPHQIVYRNPFIEKYIRKWSSLYMEMMSID